MSTDDYRKHLDFIQAVITRQASNSFLIKGWCLTVAVAAYGFALNSQSRRVAVLGIGGSLVFWGLDAYFLRQERMFRCLFKKAVNQEVAVYSMNALSFKKEAKANWFRVAMSYTLAFLYGPVFLAGWAVIYFLTTLRAKA